VLALCAVSASVGMIGHDLAWKRIGGKGAGIAPSQIWLDTGKTPHELADETRPPAVGAASAMATSVDTA